MMSQYSLYIHIPLQIRNVCGLFRTTGGIPDLLFVGMYDSSSNTEVMQFSLLNFPSVLVIIDLPNERILISAGSHHFS